MNCFSHRTTSAVGICRACGKGVCPACAADTGLGIACRDSCEERALLIGRMVTNNARIMKTANAQTRSSGLYAVLCGVVFLALAGWGYAEDKPLPMMLFCGGLGLILLLFGLVRVTAERYPSPDK